MHLRTKKIIKEVAIGTLIVIGVFLLIFGRFSFLSSSLIQDVYTSRDAGLYIAKSQPTTGTRTLMAGTGVILTTTNTLEQDKYIKTDVIVVGTGSLFTPNTVGGILSYNPDELTLVNVPSYIVTTSTGSTIDPTITQILKDPQGKEKGQLTFMVKKTDAPFSWPQEKVFTVKFEVKKLPMTASTRIAIDTLRFLNDTELNTESSNFYLDKDEASGQTYVQLGLEKNKNLFNYTFDKNASGQTVVRMYVGDINTPYLQNKIVELVMKDNVKAAKETVRYPDGKEELKEYTYAADNSYSINIKSFSSTGILENTKVENYTKDGVLIVPPMVSTGSVLPTTNTGVVLKPSTGSLLPVSPYNNYFTVDSDDKKMHIEVATGSILKETKLTITTIPQKEVALRIPESETTMISDGYKISLSNEKDTLLKNLKITITHQMRPSNENVAIVSFKNGTPDSTGYSIDLSSSTTEAKLFNATKLETYFVISVPENPNTTPTCIQANPFSDTAGHWAESYIEKARQQCIVGGKNTGAFEPNAPITRAELIKMIVNAFQLKKDNSSASIYFSDLSQNAWYYDYVTTAIQNGIIQGYKDSTVKPNANITRAEALKVILEAKAPTSYDIPYTDWLNTHVTYQYTLFPDVPAVSWYGKYVFYAGMNNVVQGKDIGGQKLFEPKNNITRAEALKMLMENQPSTNEDFSPQSSFWNITDESIRKVLKTSVDTGLPIQQSEIDNSVKSKNKTISYNPDGSGFEMKSDELLVYFKPGTSNKQAKKILEIINAKIGSITDGIGLYEIVLNTPATTYKELEEIINKMEAYNIIKSTGVNELLQVGNPDPRLPQ